MVCWHRRYRLGDDHAWSDPQDFLAEMSSRPHLRLPLYLYDHSGITISTQAFSCPWDVRIVHANGEVLDSCGGFYGAEYAIEEGRAMFAACVAERREAEACALAEAIQAERPRREESSPR